MSWSRKDDIRSGGRSGNWGFVFRERELGRTRSDRPVCMFGNTVAGDWERSGRPRRSPFDTTCRSRKYLRRTASVTTCPLEGLPRPQEIAGFREVGAGILPPLRSVRMTCKIDLTGFRNLSGLDLQAF